MSKTNLFDEALAAEGVTGKLADLARSIYTQESGGGKNTTTSNAGAVGGMQILPKTFGSVADPGWDITDPAHNARAGIRYLKQMDKLSGGVPELTAAGYYGGPNGLAKAKLEVAVSDPRNPNAPNTLQYGQQVAARLPGSVAQSGQTPGSVSQPVQVPVGGVSPAPAAPVVVAQQEAAPIPVAAAPLEQPDSK
jgi:Transglycosylase SLT domain